MASVTAVLDAVAAKVATVSGIRAFSYAPDAIVPPTAVVEIDRIEYDSDFVRGCDEMTVRISVFVSRADDRVGLAKLKSFMGGSGASSIKTVIEADPTLGGVVETLNVDSVDAIGANQVGDTWYYSCEYHVRVWVRGTS